MTPPSSFVPDPAPNAAPAGRSLAPSVPSSFVPDGSGGGQSALSTVGNFVGNTVDNVDRGFINVAATPLQLGIGLINKITGRNIPDPYAQGFPGFAGPNAIPVSSATTLGGLSQKAADTANIALMAAAPEASGVRSLGLIGAGQGLSQGLGSGDTNTTDLIKDTIAGGLFGGATGVGSNFLRWMGGVEKANTGVVGQVQNELRNADPAMVGSYIENTIKHADDVRVPTPDAMAEDAMVQRANLLVNKLIPDAGKAVGAAHAAVPDVPLQITSPSQTPVVGTEAVNSVADDINTAMQQMTGHQFSSYASGEDQGFISNYPNEGASTAGLNEDDAAIQKMPGRSIDLSGTESKQLEKLSGYLDTLRNTPDVQTASDIVRNLDNDIGNWQTPQFGANSGNSPVEGLLRYARGSINGAIRQSSPELAAANDNFSQLKDLQTDIGVAGGKGLRSASLLMRRVLSGDKSSEAIPILDRLSQITQPYMPEGDDSNLVQHAILADWAKRQFGDTSSTGLLQQSVSRGVNDAASIFGYPKQFMKNAIQGTMSALSPDPAEYAMSVAKGEPYSMNPLVRGLDELVNKASSTPVMGAFVSQLKAMGVSAHNIEPAANALFKAWLLQSLTHPTNFTPQGGGISGFTPADVPQRALTP